ncbi:hypothetical protein F511_06757 [Dorcoceras hygrometricum]|uniref:Uncharacterized protein n=1 Tax=Dorcoceras hygrometricum TaxID=472368 RepID=A0A2Z7D863_9LAMI|nr:hypothetical protein F511_06757 [Dorcoceras hygrometricum]
MAGHARYELTSASPDSSFSGNYQNGQRSYSGPALDRSSSFREGAETRMFGFGKATPRGNASSSEMPALSQCLMLDPVVIGDKKLAHSVELRRVLGFSVGSSSEDNPFGAAYPKNLSPSAVEELKRLRISVADSCVKASGRAKRFDEHLNKLHKYIDAVTCKKQQRLELMTNERSSGSTLKIGSQMHRNPSELGNQKLDDRPKNVVLNKRMRSSVTETWAESRNNGLPRSSLVAKERELVKYNNIEPDMAEEKIRRLPASGEGWDKRMKRKRSVGAVFSRSIDSDGEVKRPMHHKLASDSSLQASDSNIGFRSGVSSGSKKVDSTSPGGSNARAAIKNDQEKSALSKDFAIGQNKERAFGKGNLKLNNREDNTNCPSPTVKGKASRAPRSGSSISTNSATNLPRVPGTLESWEQPQGVSKAPSVAGVNNRKRAMPAGSSSPPITQWGGQRPNKISRTRRTNLMPVNHDEVQMPSEACSPSSFGPRSSTAATNASLLSKGASNGNQNFKAKSESVTSPSRLSNSDESGSIENRNKERGIGNGGMDEKAANAGMNVMPSVIPVEKNKNIVKKENGDGVRRQERSGRVSPFSRESISPLREKVDNVIPIKPVRNVRSGSDKNGSKSGRRLKKLSDRRGFPRPGHLGNGGSPDCSGESEDDHEELLEAANLGYNSSLDACSSEFWKTVEPLFASMSEEEKSYFLQDRFGQEETYASDVFSCERNRHIKNEIGSKDSLDNAEFVQQFQNPSLFECPSAQKEYEISTPFYQRVLSALIVEVDIEESEETGFGRPRCSVNDSCLFIGNESKRMDMLEYCEPVLGSQTQNALTAFPCNGNTDFNSRPSARDHLCNGELFQRDGEYLHSDIEVSVRFTRGNYIPQKFPANNCDIPPITCAYEQMSIDEKIVLELQSIGLLESIPDLDDKEDEPINQDIVHLERGLHEKTGKKKMSLDKICKAVQEAKNDGRCEPEQVAMDKLVELAYKKLLATKGSFASKHGIAKVSKQFALAFVKRSLARCRMFEDSGTSCFSEPPLREIIHATPPRFNESEALCNLGVAKDYSFDGYADGNSSGAFASLTHQSDHAFAKKGPVSNRGKKKEVLLDDVVGGAAFRATPALGSLGGAKGKRSERDRDRDASTRNTVAKAGRSSMASSKGDQKTKSKPKQKTAQLCTSGNGFVNKLTDATNLVCTSASGSGDSANDIGNRKRDIRFKPTGNIPPNSSKETKGSVDATNLALNDMNGMEDLGIDSEVGVPQDFNSWFSFEVEAGQEHDFIGLPTPMDELADIF